MSDNKNVVLVMGKPNSGKSASLRNLPQSSMGYINADNKEIPFKSTFRGVVPLENAVDLPGFIQDIEGSPAYTGAVLDTLTFAMALYERQVVNPQAKGKNGQAAWQDYGNFYREVIHKIKTGTKDYAVLAHVDSLLNEESMIREDKVPVKGAVGKVGVEADFTCIVASMQVPVKMLEGYENDLLHITPQEIEDGVKYCFVTRINKDFAGGKMRAPMGLWNRGQGKKGDELFIDNDLQLVFNRLKDFYAK